MSAPPEPMPALRGSLTEAWQQVVAHAPDGLALRHDGTSTTAAELERAAETLAAALADRGVGPGDRVGVQLQNVPEVVMLMLALWRRGAAAVLLNPMYAGDELRHLVTDSGAVGLLVEAGRHEEIAALVEGSDVAWLLTVGEGQAGPEQADSDQDPEHDLATILAAHKGRSAEPVAADHDTVALLTYTSGTTGPPKGAMNTHGNLLAVGATSAAAMHLTPADRVLAVAPLFHITGAVIDLATPLLAGAAVVLPGRPTPEGAARLIRDEGVTCTTGSITVFNGMDRLDLPEDTFASVRCLHSGGAPVPPATVERFEQRHGVYIHNIYGMTETSSAVIAVPPGERSPVDPTSGSLSIGKALPGVELRIVDPDGRPLPAGEPGELEIAGPAVVPGYWGKPEATAETFPEGRLRTGDGAIIDAGGWVHIVDRLKDQINVSGYKVWPREVEDALLGHPAVHEAAVVGEPDDYSGERVVAHLTLAEGADVDADELIAFARERLARYKAPREVHLVEELPKTLTGKIQRRALRDGTTRT